MAWGAWGRGVELRVWWLDVVVVFFLSSVGLFAICDSVTLVEIGGGRAAWLWGRYWVVRLGGRGWGVEVRGGVV